MLTATDNRRGCLLARGGRALLATGVLLAVHAPAVEPSPASPPPPRVYTLAECLRIGQERAVTVGNAERAERIARARIVTAVASALPQVTLNANYTRLDETGSFDFGDQTFSIGELDNYALSVGLSQLLYSGGLVKSGLRAAAHYARSARFDTETAKAALALHIRNGYYDLLLARSAVGVREESVRHLAGFVAQTEAGYRSQTVSEFELMSARVRLANEIPNLLVASNQLVLAREAFRNLVHLDDGPFEVGGSFPLEGVAGDLAALQTNGLARRPEIRSAELMVHVLEAAAAVVRSEYKPSLRAFASYTGANSYQFSFGGDWEWHWQAGVAAQWVLFEGAGRSARLLERRMQIETARAGLAELRNAVRLEIRQACLDMESARQRIAATTDNAGLAEKALAIARTRVEAGLSTSLEFAESNLALSTARLACSAALRDHAVAVARLRHAAALPDDAGSITGAQP